MSENDALVKARRLIDEGRGEEASQLLWPLCESRNSVTRLNSIFALFNALDPVRDTDKLVALSEMGIEIASKLRLSNELAYLMSRKVYYLLNSLSMLVHRAKNLTLFGRIFRWIDFSLERDEEEFAAIQERRAQMETLIHSTAEVAEQLAEQSDDHRARGQLFESIGDYYSTWYFLDCLDFQRGGWVRAKLFNLSFIRRWNLMYFLYARDDRRKILSSKRKCFAYFERAIAEFEDEALRADVARACYNYSTKLMLTNHFRRAQRMLSKAKSHLDESDSNLVRQIGELEQRIKSRNANPPDYVEALGLDMP